VCYSKDVWQPDYSNSRCRPVKTLVVVSIFILAVILLFTEVFFGPRDFLDANPYHYDPWRSYAEAGDADHKTYRTDALFTYYPRRVELTRSIRSGRMPLWNPHILAGMPFFADPQSRAVYPIALLLVLVDQVDAMAYDVAIHLVIAMFGMYLFLRSIGANIWGSVLGGLAFGFSSFFYLRFGHPTFISAAAWIPFFFYGLERARKSRVVGTVMLAAFLAMGYLAGFPQVFVFGVGALVFYAVYTSLDVGRADRRRAVSATAFILLVAGILAFLVVAVQLVPFVELLRNSTGLGVEIEKMREIYLAPPILLLRSFFPSLFGNPIEGTDWSGLTRDLRHPYNPEFAVYCGLGALLAAAGAVVFVKRERHVRVFLIMVLVTVGLATSELLLKAGYAVVPLLDVSRVSRISIVSCFALSALGGLGLSMLTGKMSRQDRRRFLTGSGVIAGALLVVGLYVTVAGDSFVRPYLESARALPESVYKHTHQEMRSGEIRKWAQGTGREWVEYERHQVARGMAFLVPALGLLALLAYPGKKRESLKTALAVAFISVVAVDAGLNANSYFLSQVSHRLFETAGIDLLEDGVGDAGKWRIRSVRYRDEDVKAFPPNTNLIFDIHSLNGASTIWPDGYQRLYDAFGESRPPSKRWDKQMAISVYEALASDFACVRYAVASKEGLPVIFSPMMKLVAAKAGTPSRVRVMEVGREARVAIWQRPGETFNFSMDLPPAKALDFAVGFDAESASPGDAITAWMIWEKSGETARFRHTFDGAGDGDRWHHFRLGVSGQSGGRVRIMMGCEASGPGGRSPLALAWSGLDLVSGDCGLSKDTDAHRISLDAGAEYVALEIASGAREVPLEILLGGAGRRLRWVAFPPQMPVRKVFLDVRGRIDDWITLRSDSIFTVRRCDVVYLDVGCPDYELIYDKDMYIYENLAAIRKGVCLEREAIEDLAGSKGGIVVVSLLEEIGDVECGRCEILEYGPEEVLLDVRADKDCFLLFQDVYYPGWKAYVDGDRAELRQTDIGMRAIELSAGEHSVEMRFRPGSIRVGLLLTCLGIILSAAVALKKLR
jgi:hypothetical protein